MPKADDILWFKQQFQTRIAAAIQGTPFSVDMITAIACQETGFIWQVLRKRQMSVERILELCVGDTIDAKPKGGRRVFPKNKAELVARQGGAEMFAIARQGLVDMAQHINGYASAVANPNKFCHGFGIFQFDLQFFETEPEYFLQKRYANFDASLGKCVAELRSKQRRIGLQNRTTLTDLEMTSVAIAYNTGNFIPSKGLKQGHFDGKKFYGENFFDFIRLSKSVVVTGESPAPQPAPSTETPVPQPAPSTGIPAATGPLYEVEVRESPLLLRREPKRDPSKPLANVIARLADGHIVRAVTNEPVDGFLEVETSVQGVNHRGFASAQFLKLSPP